MTPPDVCVYGNGYPQTIQNVWFLLLTSPKAQFTLWKPKLEVSEKTKSTAKLPTFNWTDFPLQEFTFHIVSRITDNSQQATANLSLSLSTGLRSAVPELSASGSSKSTFLSHSNSGIQIHLWHQEKATNGEKATELSRGVWGAHHGSPSWTTSFGFGCTRCVARTGLQLGPADWVATAATDRLKSKDNPPWHPFPLWPTPCHKHGDLSCLSGCVL